MTQPQVTDAMIEAGAQALYKSEMTYVSKRKALDEAGKLGPIYRRKSRTILQAALAHQDGEVVAYQFELDCYGAWKWQISEFNPLTVYSAKDLRNVHPLYAHPPAMEDAWRPIREAPIGMVNGSRPRLLLWVPPYGPFTGVWDGDAWSIPGLLNKEAKPTMFCIPNPPKQEDA